MENDNAFPNSSLNSGKLNHTRISEIQNEIANCKDIEKQNKAKHALSEYTIIEDKALHLHENIKDRSKYNAIHSRSSKRTQM